ncbi:MAG: hypothetical protein V1754_10010, partial [Pseudomonadota bacterium]
MRLHGQTFVLVGLAIVGLCLSSQTATAQKENTPGSAAAAPTIKAVQEPVERESESPRGDPGISAPTINGLSGLFRLVTTETGGNHTFRLGLHTELFKSSDFLVAGDSNSRFLGTLAASYTPLQYLEFFFNVRSQTNSNERNEPARMDQEAILSLGDFGLGGKFQYPIAPYF